MEAVGLAGNWDGFSSPHSFTGRDHKTRNSVLTSEASRDTASPSRGLSMSQMARAIENHGLEPFYINPENEHVLKNNVYAYLQGKIPVLMTIRLVDYCEGKAPEFRRDIHAVAVTGYSLGNAEPIPLKKADDNQDDKSGFLSKASRIDKIYVHDDQVGPFIRMEFGQTGAELKLPDDFRGRWSYFLSTSWRCNGNKSGVVRAGADSTHGASLPQDSDSLFHHPGTW